MLWKLLKYDFRAMWKQFSIIWPAALALALVNRFTVVDGYLEFLGDTASALLVFAYGGILVAMSVVSIIFILRRFSRGLLGDEGYLMHTLPVRSWQLVASKLICALFVTGINLAVALFSIVFLIPIRHSELGQLGELLRRIAIGLGKHPDTILYGLELFLGWLVFLSLGVTMLYLSMSLGHLFSRRRTLMSVVFFFLIQIVHNSILGRLLDSNPLTDWLRQGGFTHLAALCVILLALIPTALFFAGTCYILKTHLNLE